MQYMQAAEAGHGQYPVPLSLIITDMITVHHVNSYCVYLTMYVQSVYDRQQVFDDFPVPASPGAGLGVDAGKTCVMLAISSFPSEFGALRLSCPSLGCSLLACAWAPC
jgi:hypothetical protein